MVPLEIRILLLNRFFYPDQSATSQMLTDLAEDLVGRGYQVTVIAGRYVHNDPARLLPAWEEWNGIRIHRVRTSGFGRGSLAGRLLDYASFFPAAFFRALRIPRPDCVIALSDPPLLVVLAALLCKLRGLRLIHWAHDVYPDVAVSAGVIRPGGWWDRLLSRLSGWGLKRADWIVAIGEKMASRFKNKGVDRIRVIPNWADGKRIFPVSHEGNRFRVEQGWNGKFVVMYSGNMGIVHDFSPLCEAMRRLADMNRILFVFIGEGERRRKLVEFVRREGLRNAVFLPLQDRARLHESLGAADLHLVVLASSMDGLVVPSKLYGIMAAGRPTLFIGNPDSEISTILERYGCGVTAPDAASVENTIRLLATDPECCAAMGRKARRAFETLYDRPMATSAFEELLRNLMDAGGDPRLRS